MKIVVTYEPADLRRLIQQDLARQGIDASEAEVKFAKNTAVVTVDTALAVAAAAAALPSEPPAPLPAHDATAPELPVVVDIVDVLSRSAGLARADTGLYPPRERALMEGETYEYPGDKRR